MTVNIDWKLVQNPNVMADYIDGVQQRNELNRTQLQVAIGRSQLAGLQSAAGPAQGAGAQGAGSADPGADAARRAETSHDLLAGIQRLRGIAVGAGGDTSARMQAARAMLPALMQRNPGLDPQALDHMDLSDEGLARAERSLLGAGGS